MLAADPQLSDNSAIAPSAARSAIALDTGSNTPPTPNSSVQLPADFPPEIPRYPNAQLQQVTPSETRWSTADPSNVVQNFYQKEFQANNWEFTSQPANDVQQNDTIEVQQNDLQVTVTVPTQATQQNTTSNTQFTIRYTRNATTASQSTDTEVAEVPQPGDSTFIGPIPQQSSTPAASPSPDRLVTTFTDINQAPQELRQYIQDLTALGVLPIQSTTSKSSVTTTQFEPSKTITRREYARWLVSTNNQFYADTPAKQIRAVSTATQSAFQDVPPADPDFSVIQGLAEAGIIPSALSGSSTTVLFRPDAPLTREQMMLWKVPIDTRQALPAASVDAVQQTWGFQDAAKIEPRALQAVLADFQNSEQSNIRRVFGYTTLFQPKKTVTRAEAAAALWYIGTASEGVSARNVLQLQQQPSTSNTLQSPSPSPE